MKTYVTFGIHEYDDITAEEITDIIQLSPTHVFVKGTPVREGSPKIARVNAWKYEVDGLNREEYESFNKQIDALFEILSDRKELLKPLCDKYEIEISCVLYLDTTSGVTSTPIVHIEKKWSELTAYLNIEWDFDIICVSDRP